MKILIDMNLSPDWAPALTGHGFDAVHWSAVGDPRATDRAIMTWAFEHGYIIFTHDLDFGTLLAVGQAGGPSVIQVRTQDVTIGHLEALIVDALVRYADLLERGALITLDESKSRVRILPLAR